jgi:voltage-gated potassium channel
VKENFTEKDGNYEKFILILYFALTTLSTVGYGDYYPNSDVEMIITSIVMLGGVAFFSYIMGNFIDIISNYEKKMGGVNKTEELDEWIIGLERF